jgi:hypothetical protein
MRKIMKDQMMFEDNEEAKIHEKSNEGLDDV